MLLWKIYVDDLPIEDDNANLFMDDIVFWSFGETAHDLQNKLQLQANRVEDWINQNDLVLNHKKTKLMLNKGFVQGFCLRLCGTTFYPCERLRYLGADILSKEDDEYLHIDFSKVGADLYRRCSLISRVSSIFSRENIRNFGQAIVMGKLSYYLPFAGSEASDSLRHLEVGLNHCMRLVTGAFISTPVPILHSSSGIPPLSLLIDRFASNMLLKLRTQNSLLSRDYYAWNLLGEGCSPLGRVWKCHQYIQAAVSDFGCSFDDDESVEFPQVPPLNYWEALYACRFTIFESKKAFFEQHSDVGMFEKEVIQAHDLCLWTDGSLSGDSKCLGSGGFVVTAANDEVIMELGETFYPIFSSFQAESLALRGALDNFVSNPENCRSQRICILSDSQGLLRHLKKLQLQAIPVSPLILDIMHALWTGFQHGVVLFHFIWIPGHSNIKWNECADELASKAYIVDKNPLMPEIPCSALKGMFKRRMNQEFTKYLQDGIKESSCQEYPERSFFKAPVAARGGFKTTELTKFELRIRSGHNRLNAHLHRLKMSNDPFCRYCKTGIEEPMHVLLECTSIPGIYDFTKVRMHIPPLNRKEWCNFLFSQEKESKSLRQDFCKLCLKHGIAI